MVSLSTVVYSIALSIIAREMILLLLLLTNDDVTVPLQEKAAINCNVCLIDSE